jgi:cobalt-zinc-cadmium efflux system outer membrane protein
MAGSVLGASLNLEQAVVRTLERHPALAITEQSIAAQQGRAVQAGLRPNPELALDLENFLGSGIYSGLDNVEATLSVSWVLERGKRRGRVAAAQAHGDLLNVDAQIERLELASDTALAFLSVLTDQERLDRTSQAVKLADETLIAIRERVEAGKAPSADEARAAVDLAWVQLELEDVEHQLLVSRQRLAAQWGSRAPDFDRVDGDIYVMPEPPGFQQLLDRFATSPMINRFLTERRVAEAELRLAEARAKPDWRLSAGVRHLGVVEENAFVAGFRVPITTSNRNQGRIAELSARVLRATAEQTATRLAIETNLFDLHQELMHNAHRSHAIGDEILPRLREALGDTQRAYMAGRYGYREFRMVQAQLLEAEMEFLNESFLAHRNSIEIERLTGTALHTSGTGGVQ